MNKPFQKLIVLTLTLIALAVPALASQQPNLAVQAWAGPTAAMVNTTYQYTATVKNVGNQTASGVTMTIEFPLTNTSPNRHILGKVTAFPSNCSIVANKLQCSFGNVSRNPNANTRTVTFNYEYPVTTKPLELVARAATTSTNEADPQNNSRTFSPTVNYPNLPITSADVLVSLCTGQNLTSYTECELYPSSIQSFTMRLEQGGSITVPYPGYFGNWDQPTQKQLHFTVTDGSDGAEFNGFAANSTCFDGITNFTPASPYMSAYRVCVQ